MITAIPMPPEQMQASLGSGSVTVKGEVPLEMTSESSRGFSMITGVELGEEKEPDANRPSLILRRAGNGRLWDIAKESGSTMDAIRKANGLQEEGEPRGCTSTREMERICTDTLHSLFHNHPSNVGAVFLPAKRKIW